MDARFDDLMPVLFFAEKMFDRLEGDTKLQLSFIFWGDIDNNTKKLLQPMHYAT